MSTISDKSCIEKGHIMLGSHSGRFLVLLFRQFRSDRRDYDGILTQLQKFVV